MRTDNIDRNRSAALTERAQQLNAALLDVMERRREAHNEKRRWHGIADAKRDELKEHAPTVYVTHDPAGAIYNAADPRGPEKAARAEAERWTAEAARLDAEYARLQPRWAAASRLAQHCAAYLVQHDSTRRGENIAHAQAS